MSRTPIYALHIYRSVKEQKRIEAAERQARPLRVLPCGHRSALQPEDHNERAHSVSA